MAGEQNLSQGLNTLLSGIGNFFSGLGMRLAVHLGSLLAAGFGADVLFDAGTNWWRVFFIAYLGGIFWMPRGIARKYTWMLPFGAGAALGAALLFFGLPWPLALFWSGAQTYVQRIISTKGRMGWEWAGLPWLLGGFSSFFSLPLSFGSLVPACFVGTAVLFGIGQKGYARLRLDPIHRGMFAGAAEILRGLVRSRRLPNPLIEPLRLLAENADRFRRLAPRMDENGIRLALETQAAALAAGAVARAQTQSWSSQAGELLTRIDKLNADLASRLAGLPSSSDVAVGGPLAAFQDSVLSLSGKSSALPSDLRAKAEGICRAADAIILSLQNDPQDLAPGTRFLSRYLKAAHSLTDDYIRLAALPEAPENTKETLARCGDMLDRLEKAFIGEHKALMQNDVVDFAADLNVLDTLLKMDGK